MTKKVIVSACLAGLNCRYDGDNKRREDIVEMVKRGEAIPVCPEQLGGLSTPREPAEAVEEKVLTINGRDVTFEYSRGADEAFLITQMSGATEALLKSKSPMCGVGSVYDGSFTGTMKNDDGIFTKLLKKAGIKVTPVD
ncbi:DUF523 domain-containing protein [Halobacteriovorax sp. JY17]|uniref:DUF523 domain-containing protein n=1 Tax=Halobacteriovorax sp. JY17 TaxID=2014617 RepID=UPI000C4DF370|nr:DUF523 domain-containing protein [Halobacteriovorax sp. JY17]PIK16091.1 MAG: purine-nucleoside phosphorylase [Halobacteriovorax sp. JY17]